MPQGSKIQLVFHCLLLKLHQGHQGPLPVPPTSFPPLATNNHPLVAPLSILDSKMNDSTKPRTKLVSVQWLGLSPEDTSWEEWDDTYHLEDKMSFPTEGDYSNVTHNTRPMRTTPTTFKDYV
ncbi:hypothetical protein GYH30_047620 [Glycine max]|nr:hypothetical protein JHK86_047754 [Glycine max]KAH1118903.1 hypothetical protein GYH30_047620 [Glycine max]